MKNIIFQYVILFFSFYNIISVQAQEADSSAYDLEEIVISANKFAENKRDVAQQIQSISQKQIQVSKGAALRYCAALKPVGCCSISMACASIISSIAPDICKISSP